jgi:hypothetical protein
LPCLVKGQHTKSSPLRRESDCSMFPHNPWPLLCCTQQKSESIYVFTASTKRQARQDYVLPCHASANPALVATPDDRGESKQNMGGWVSLAGHPLHCNNATVRDTGTDARCSAVQLPAWPLWLALQINPPKGPQREIEDLLASCGPCLF